MKIKALIGESDQAAELELPNELVRRALQELFRLINKRASDPAYKPHLPKLAKSLVPDYMADAQNMRQAVRGFLRAVCADFIAVGSGPLGVGGETLTQRYARLVKDGRPVVAELAGVNVELLSVIGDDNDQVSNQPTPCVAAAASVGPNGNAPRKKSRSSWMFWGVLLFFLLVAFAGFQFTTTLRNAKDERAPAAHMSREQLGNPITTGASSTSRTNVAVEGIKELERQLALLAKDYRAALAISNHTQLRLIRTEMSNLSRRIEASRLTAP